MLIRGLSLSLAAVIALGVLAESAAADHRRKPHRVTEDEFYYGGPPIIRDIPGLRIFFGDYALSEEEFDQLYNNRRRHFDEDYYEPEPVQPRRKARAKAVVEQPQKPKAAAKAKPAGEAKTATAESQPRKTAQAGLSCDKATSVVSGYGFTSVTPSSCNGKVYAFNAVRDGKNFAIKLDSGSGELTEVKKLP